MKIPRINISPDHKRRATRIFATFSAIMYRLVPIVVLAAIFAQGAIIIDQNHYREAEASEFLNYTEFTVQNARENEDVYFKICRERVSTIHYDGDLSVYIIANADKSDEKRVQVYSRDISGSVTNNCENKVIRAVDFKHAVGTYEMGFCVSFKVKYGFDKEACRTSNRYRIYNQPTDLESKIRDLETQLQTAQEQLRVTQGNISGNQSPSLAVPQGSPRGDATPNTSQQGTTEKTKSNDKSNSQGQQGTGVIPPACVIKSLGIGLLCGNDGLIKL